MFDASSRWRELFQKWNLLPGLVIAKFRVRPRISDDVQVVKALLADENVGKLLGLASTSDTCCENVVVEKLQCGVVNMKCMIDALVENGKQ